MVCPKCKKTVGENDAVCRNCGVALKEPKKKPDVKSFFDKKKKAPEDKLNISTKKNTTKILRIAMAAAAVLLIVILIIVLVVHLSSGKGNKIAMQTAEYIGDTLPHAEEGTGYHFKSDSAFRGFNQAVAFDEVYEPESETRVDDISYPEWSVTVNLNKSNKIESVVYTDFESVSKDSRGEKKNKSINLDKFDKGTKYSTVSDEIDLDPYSITYKDVSTTYVYKYYYMTDYGDAQPVVLSVTFDENDKLTYDSVEYIYPKNM